MSIFSYVITHDTGFAPNPFGGVLTLATCKPKIRRVAKPRDWVVGTGSCRSVVSGRVVFVAQIAEKLRIEDYGDDDHFACKRPVASRESWRRHGDNIYQRRDSEWRQLRNPHHTPEDMKLDLSGRFV